MIIYKLIGKLYTEKDSKWIQEMNDTDIVPFVIQKWLCMNDKVRQHVHWLDKYVFHLPPKMYLSLAWSILPKTPKAPYAKYISDKEAKKHIDEFEFILCRIRKHLKLSDNDYESCKDRLVKNIKNDTENWFAFYGIEKKHWKKHYLDFNKIKTFGNDKKVVKGLDAWGL